MKRGTLLATGLQAYVADPDLQQEWMMVKKVNKMRLAEYIESMSGVKVWSQVLRTSILQSEYTSTKKQLLNILALSIDMTVLRFEYFKLFKYIPTNTKLALAEDGTCFVLRGSAPRKDPTRLAALLPPSDCLAAQRPPSRLEPA
ncbi:unnamed protein product [Prunus armeniaca]